MPVSNGQLISRFVDYLQYECGATENNIAAHEQSLTHLAAWLEPMWLPDATRIMLQLYIGDSLNSGASARTVGRRLSHLRHFYRMLIREKEIETDPTSYLAVPKHCSRTKAKDPQHSVTVATWVRMDWDAYL
jgi:site-specific recombinase XerD